MTATTALPIHLTSKIRTVPGHIGAVGPASILRDAYAQDAPVTLSGKFAGEQVYLGHTRQTYDEGVTLERIGLDQDLGESPKHPGVQVAVYLIDFTRLENAPRLAEFVRGVEAERLESAMQAERRAQEEEDRYLNRQEG